MDRHECDLKVSSCWKTLKPICLMEGFGGTALLDGLGGAALLDGLWRKGPREGFGNGLGTGFGVGFGRDPLL
jgi:hypothetical protein